MSRVFEHFNALFGAVCHVCNTNADWPTVLVPIPGTEDDGICEARQVHKRCYDLLSAAGAEAISRHDILYSDSKPNRGQS